MKSYKIYLLDFLFLKFGMQITFFLLNVLLRYLEGRNGTLFCVFLMASMVMKIRFPRSSDSMTSASAHEKNPINTIPYKKTGRPEPLPPSVDPTPCASDARLFDSHSRFL